MWSGFNVREIGKEGKRGRGWLRFGIDEGGSGGCEVKRSQEKVKRVELGFTCMEIDKGVPSLSENSGTLLSISNIDKNVNLFIYFRFITSLLFLVFLTPNLQFLLFRLRL